MPNRAQDRATTTLVRQLVLSRCRDMPLPPSWSGELFPLPFAYHPTLFMPGSKGRCGLCTEPLCTGLAVTAVATSPSSWEARCADHLIRAPYSIDPDHPPVRAPGLTDATEPQPKPGLSSAPPAAPGAPAVVERPEPTMERTHSGRTRRLAGWTTRFLRRRDTRL